MCHTAFKLGGLICKKKIVVLTFYPLFSLCIQGWYIYVESSDQNQGDEARISSPFMQTTTQQCLQFWFHMFGDTVDTLNVYSRRTDAGASSLGTLVWTRNGEQSDQWMQGQVHVAESVNFQVKNLQTGSKIFSLFWGIKMIIILT